MATHPSRVGPRWIPALITLLVASTPAAGLYLDDAQQISLRTRVYSQASIRTNDSQLDTVPTTKVGQLVQHRNFFNPELDATLTTYLGWLQGTWLARAVPDELTLRAAGWGFYDGIYDYGAGQFDTAQKRINSTIGDFTNPNRRSWVIEGSEFNCPRRTRTGLCVAGVDPATGRNVPYSSLDQLFPGYDARVPRDVYADQARLNELYLTYVKGPVFVRFGKQAISWGESDTIALLDQNNPFDTTLAIPGFYQDLDEARIPLWTLRTSLTVFDTWRFLSSGVVEAYWVPGDLDTTVAPFPMLGASPYSPRGQDPQQDVGPVAQFVQFDHRPDNRFEHSRWGVRVQAVAARTHTVSAWYYTTYPNNPVPRSLGLAQTSYGVPLYTVETVYDLTGVVGLADTFFFEPIDSIIRLEAEYFDNEPAFIPQRNLNITAGPPDPSVLTKVGQVPKADFLRWELGVDRFFFVRALNPTNSFTLVSSFVGSWNLDETSRKDFRFSGQRKPGTNGTSPDDYVQLKTVEAFLQARVQTDYMHGRLTPGITVILNARGTYGLLPGVSYRMRDWLLLSLQYGTIGGEYQQIGFYRDRDQLALRATYQLN